MFPEERWVKDEPEVGVQTTIEMPRNGRRTIKLHRDTLRSLLVAAGYRREDEHG